MADFVYVAGTEQFALTPDFDTIFFPGGRNLSSGGADRLTGFTPGPTGDRIDLTDWLQASPANLYPTVPSSRAISCSSRMATTPSCASTSSRLWEDPVTCLAALEGVQMSALTPRISAMTHGRRRRAGGERHDRTAATADHRPRRFDSLDGAGGNDRIYGGRGEDNLSGGDGDDL